MNNKQFIEFQSMVCGKTNHEIIGMLFQRLEEMRTIITILNKREEKSMEVNLHGKERKTTKTKTVGKTEILEYF